jgi:predicted flavoprotein YhiN
VAAGASSTTGVSVAGGASSTVVPSVEAAGSAAALSSDPVAVSTGGSSAVTTGSVGGGAPSSASAGVAMKVLTTNASTIGIANRRNRFISFMIYLLKIGEKQKGWDWQNQMFIRCDLSPFHMCDYQP